MPEPQFKPVGASLLAKASDQSISKGLEDRFREQARAHRVLHKLAEFAQVVEVITGIFPK